VSIDETASLQRPRGFWIVVLLLAVEAGMRIFFFFASFSTDLVESDVSQTILDFSISMFLVLGVAGLALLYPLVQRRPVGYYGTLTVCIGTIVFDVWGVFAVQSSAAMGIVVPAAAIGFLWIFRRRLLPTPADATR
jgi:hypothetical protein